MLVVHCHPVPDSFCAALRDAVIEALAKAGHKVDTIDLYAEGFDPVMRADERRSYNESAPSDPALRPHIDRVMRADALVFVYPTWWYGLPAMLKGWLERVWSVDVAFALPVDGGSIRPLMRHIRKIAVVTTCGAPWWWSFAVGQPGRKTILRGIRALCARNCRTLYLAHYGMDASTAESRRTFLAKVERRLSAW